MSKPSTWPNRLYPKRRLTIFAFYDAQLLFFIGLKQIRMVASIDMSQVDWEELLFSDKITTGVSELEEEDILMMSDVAFLSNLIRSDGWGGSNLK